MSMFGLHALLAPAAFAQSYPVKPIRLIVGSGPDVIPRIFAQKLGEVWAPPVVVDPRPGVGGALAAEIVAKSQPDGYTLLWVTAAHAMLASFGVGKFDLAGDFSPVIMATVCPYVLAVNPSVNARSVPELIALARAQPGKLNYASVGNGSPGHLAVELLKSHTGINVVHVPYKTVAGAMTDLTGGHIDFLIQVAAAVRGLAESGRIRALAVTTAQRSRIFPDLPSMIEAGYPGFEIVGWNGILAPSAAPRASIAALNAEINRALLLPEIAQRVNGSACEPAAANTPASFGAVISRDIEKWKALIKSAGLKTD
jgi:tripartite-type tricarboxylate transporter receptor subunit TctC